MLWLWRGPGLAARSLLRGGPGQLGGWVNLRAEPGGRGVAFTRHHVKTIVSPCPALWMRGSAGHGCRFRSAAQGARADGPAERARRV
jgi:hypothetical protein